MTIAGACPADAADIKCCTKASCSNTSAGNCRWQSDCAGSSVANQCPGPAQMKCCSSAATGFGGYAAPAFPAVGACKAVAVNGAKTLVAAWPGRVRQIYCTRDCACPGTSDHCCGKAIDFMCSDGGGVSYYPFPSSGEPLRLTRTICICRFRPPPAVNLLSGR